MAPRKRSSKPRDAVLWENIRKVYKFEKDDREEALAAVQRAARFAVETVLVDPKTRSTVFGADLINLPPSTNNSNRHHNPDGSISNDSQTSYLSRERALFRGSSRGLFEENEIGSRPVTGGDGEGGGSLDGFDFDRDLATIEETRQSTVSDDNSKKKKRGGRLSRLFRKKKSSLSQWTTQQMREEAWMCGVCSKSFLSFDAAKKHEDYHIKEIVADLGWLCADTEAVRASYDDTDDDDNNNNNNNNNNNGAVEPSEAAALTARAAGMMYEASSRGMPRLPKMSSVANLSTAPRPDILTVSKARRSTAIAPTPPSVFLSSGETKYEPINDYDDFVAEVDSALPHGMPGYVVLADEALIDVCSKAEAWILTHVEQEAEFELEMYSKDKEYYTMLEMRDIERQGEGAYSRFRTDGKNLAQKVQNKMVDAYAIMKEGKAKKRDVSVDHYKRKYKGDSQIHNEIENTNRTLYVNVIVKNSINVVSHELERLAKQRWEEYKETHEEKLDSRNADSRAQFEKFKAAAQGNLVKLAGMALASDFTPRRIAVQLSNDLYRLIAPRLKRRGVFIETEIEYRVGPYFVLAVNVLRVDWRRLVKMTNRDVAERRAIWIRETEAEAEKESHARRFYGPIISSLRLLRMTRVELLAQFLALLYHTHWIIFTPICSVLYHFLIGDMFRTYFLTSVTDEIFFYVEQKGMEMAVVIRDSQNQAGFMISALKEIRADGKEKKKKQKGETDETEEELLGPLLGPLIKEDSGPAPPIPDGFEPPENFEFVGLELSLGVGFRRLRWAMLSAESKFMTDAIFRVESNYEDIEVKPWNKFNESIGLPKLPDGVNVTDFIDAETECQYLMPKSAFVSANMCYETSFIEAYNDYCFAIKNRALTPGVPYGGTFEAWTRYVVINTGNNTCKMICSVEPVFPNGPPMISGQIRSGMRSGVGMLFVKIGETIEKYKNEVP